MDPHSLPRPTHRIALLLTVLVPPSAWLLWFVHGAVFIWDALGAVQARHAFRRELADFAQIMVAPSVFASLLVVPVAIHFGRAPTGRRVVRLAVLSVVMYGMACFLGCAYYSTRIT